MHMNQYPTSSAADASPDTAQSDGLATRTRHQAEAAHDAGLVQRFKAGDEAAFTEIVQRHYARIRTLARQTVHDSADADEIVQDTFIRAHRALAGFRGDCSLSSWLYRIGLNLARNRYWFNFRRRRHDTTSLDQVTATGTESLGNLLTLGQAGPRTDSITNEFVALVSRCLDRLDASHREILLMRIAQDLSYEEMADCLGINIGTVKSRVARARENLRDLLRREAPELGRDAEAADFFEFDRPLHFPGLAPA